jgi:hypothetical protein
MWIISQIGGKNMTGKLQKRTGFKFFLILISAAFDAGHIIFEASIKWFTRVALVEEWRCEYRKK